MITKAQTYAKRYKRGIIAIALVLLCLTLTDVVMAQSGSANTSGYVYLDANANGHREPTEGGTGITSLFAKLMKHGASVAGKAVAVGVDGYYEFTNVSDVDSPYDVIIDDNNVLNDIVPINTPDGYIGTEFSSPTLKRENIVVAGTSVYYQNFGLYEGGKLSGTVFKDIGVGTANNGIEDGGEQGIANVNIKVVDSANNSIVYATAITNTSGEYTVYIPNSADGKEIIIIETNPTGYNSTGGNLDGDSSKYERNSDAITFTFESDGSYTNADFGDAPKSTLTNDGNRTVVPGGAVFFPHVFTAGTAGEVIFTVTNISTPNNSGWTHLIYEVNDNDGDGVGDLEPNDTPITGPITVQAGEKVYVIIKENAPANATDGAEDAILITSHLTYDTATITEDHARTDVARVGRQTELNLHKTVNIDNAGKGDELTYTITYTNNSDQPIKDLVIDDFVPAFTTFVDAPQPTSFPAGLTAVTIGKPPVGGIGSIKWTFTGELAPGASGIVTFDVKVNE